MTEHGQHEVARQSELQGDWIECVYLTCFRSEFASLATVLYYSSVRLLQAGSLDEADFLLTVTGAMAFLSDVTYPDGNWRDALYMVAEVHPRAASVVVADPVDRPFLADAYTRGACAVLWKPFDFTHATELIRTVDQAARDRAIWLATLDLSELGDRIKPAIPSAVLRTSNDSGQDQSRFK